MMPVADVRTCCFDTIDLRNVRIKHLRSWLEELLALLNPFPDASRRDAVSKCIMISKDTQTGSGSAVPDDEHMTPCLCPAAQPTLDQNC